MAGYIGNQAQIRSGLSATIDELNIIDGVTATTAELNILDGVTSTATELNILDGVTATTAELNIMDGVTATTAELNIMDGVTATAAEINLIDGGTARGTTTIVDADGVLVNDDGTMRMTTMATLATYINTKVGAADVAFPSNWASPTNTYTSSATWSKGSLDDDDYVWFFLLGGGGGGDVNTAGFGGSVRLIYATAGLLNGAAFVVGAGSAGVNSGAAAAGGQTILTLSSGNGSSVFATPTDDTNNILNVVTAPTPNVSGTYLNGGPDEAYGFSTKPLPSGYEKVFTGSYAEDVIFGGARGTATGQAASTSLLSGNGGVNTGGDGAAPGGGGAAGHGSGQIGGDGVAGNVRVYHV